MSLASDTISLRERPLRVRPACPKCKKTMMMARISPVSPGIDEVTYDCRACNNSETVLEKR